MEDNKFMKENKPTLLYCEYSVDITELPKNGTELCDFLGLFLTGSIPYSVSLEDYADEDKERVYNKYGKEDITIKQIDDYAGHIMSNFIFNKNGDLLGIEQNIY